MTTTGIIADAILAIRDNAYYCGDYELVDGNYRMDITVDHDLNVIFNRIEKRRSVNDYRTVSSIPDGFNMEELVSFIKRYSLIKKGEIERDEENERLMEKEIKSLEFNSKQINWSGTMAGY